MIKKPITLHIKLTYSQAKILLAQLVNQLEFQKFKSKQKWNKT